MGYGVVDMTPNVSFAIPQGAISADIQAELSAKDFIIAPLVGYNWSWGRFDLGAEFQAFWTSIKEDTNRGSPSSGEDISLSNEYVWLLRPGYQIFPNAPLLLYLNVGAAYTKITAVPGTHQIQAINFDEHVWGYKAGLGAGYELTTHLMIRFDYIFSQYETLTHTAPQYGLSNKPVPVTAEFPTTQSQYLIGLTYNW
jgi:opacity protein-like surface antigen